MEPVSTSGATKLLQSGKSPWQCLSWSYPVLWCHKVPRKRDPVLYVGVAIKFSWASSILFQLHQFLQTAQNSAKTRKEICKAAKPVKSGHWYPWLLEKTWHFWQLCGLPAAGVRPKAPSFCSEGDNTCICSKSLVPQYAHEVLQSLCETMPSRTPPAGWGPSPSPDQSIIIVHHNNSQSWVISGKDVQDFQLGAGILTSLKSDYCLQMLFLVKIAKAEVLENSPRYRRNKEARFAHVWIDCR